MSRINDALKQARKTPGHGTPVPPPPRPLAEPSSSVAGWLAPVFMLVLIIAIVFYIGWEVANHSVNAMGAAPAPVAATPEVAAATPPPSSLPPVPASTPPLPSPPSPPSPPPEPVVPDKPPALPRLQGIFYSPSAPTAIIGGKIVRPGDHLGQFLVQRITTNTVALVASDGKTYQLGLAN